MVVEIVDGGVVLGEHAPCKVLLSFGVCRRGQRGQE